MSTISLPCQMLCASVCTYAITTSEKSGRYNPVGPNSPYQNQYDAIGFINDPFVVTDIQIEAALVGQTADSIIVAFRGTLPPAFNWDSFFDWLEDFMVPPIDAAPYIKGKVHAGFLAAMELLEAQIVTAINTLDPSGTLPVYITGHSKGGGIAPIAAMYLKNKHPYLNIVQTITFAGPNSGNGEFQSAYNDMFPNHIRYENYLDLVPILPPDPEFIELLEAIPDVPASFIAVLNDMLAYDYEPVGNLMYIDSSGDASAYSTLEAEGLLPLRMGEIAVELAELDLSAIADAHHPGCGYGYMNGTCSGSGVCPV